MLSCLLDGTLLLLNGLLGARCGMVHIKEPLLLIDKSSLCGGSGFPFLHQNGP